MNTSRGPSLVEGAWLERWSLAATVSDAGLFPDQRPFSFSLNGQSSHEVLPSWQYSVEAPQDTARVLVTWRDPAHRLAVTADVRRLDPFGAVYYLLRITNEGARDTPILEDILPLDAGLGWAETMPLVLHHAHGSTNAVDDFLPLTTEIGRGQGVTFAGAGGRPSNGVLPFFNLARSEGGLILAIGWSGQWQATFRRGLDGGLRLSAGMERTHLRLRPGESIRTPGILLLPWKGEDWQDAQNELRHLMLAHFTPRRGGRPVIPPVSHDTAASLHMHDNGWLGGNEETQMASIKAIAPLGVEAYWLDAYWFPNGYQTGVGNWFPRPDDFPRGLRPLGDATHERDMSFILWFEPERVGPGSQLDQEHPEWVLKQGRIKPGEGHVGSRLLDLGNPEAREYITDVVSSRIGEYGVDVYRQDFNIDPLSFWQAQDAPDRVGMTEIKHVEGLYAFWDALVERDPDLWIDNCASGGRRIDLETCSRALVLTRSDMTDGLIFDVDARETAGLADQVQTAGLNLWLPLHAGLVWGMDPYRFRSALQAGIGLYDDPRQSEFPHQLAAKAIEELKSLRPYYLGDYYLLTPVTTSEKDWCAYQYHRADLGAGFALYFCRAECETLSMPVRLRAIDGEARYRVVLSESYDYPDPVEMSGAELNAYTVTVTGQRRALLLRYQQAEVG